MHQKKVDLRRASWIFLGAGMLVLQYGAQFAPDVTDLLYSRGIFPVIRLVIDYTTGFLPFPTIWLVLCFVLWGIYRLLIAPLFRRKARFAGFIRNLLVLAGMVVFFFYFLWGLNYRRPPVEARIGLELKKHPPEDLKREFDIVTSELKDAFASLEDPPLSWNIRDIRKIESKIRSDVENQLANMGYPVLGRVRARLLQPGGSLLIWNTAGIYIPFSSEGHVDAGLLPVQMPFVMAHEMTHGYGITDEGSCNFVAYLACGNSDHAFIKFTCILGYWRYVAAEYRYEDPEAFKLAYADLPAGIPEILEAIRRNNHAYPEVLPAFRNLVYDQYLKSHGIADGLRSYARVVTMVMAYREMRSAKIPGDPPDNN